VKPYVLSTRCKDLCPSITIDIIRRIKENDKPHITISM